MDLTPEKLHSFGIYDILKEPVSIAKLSPKTFFLITVTLIFPVSFASLVQSFFTLPLFAHAIRHFPLDSESLYELIKLYIFQVGYLMFVHNFSLLSIASIVFTVASLYTSKPVCFISSISAIPKLFKPLFITFSKFAFIMIACELGILFFLAISAMPMPRDFEGVLLQFIYPCFLFVIYTALHACITAFWQIASVVSVVEPFQGDVAMKKSRELLKGRLVMAAILVSGYLLLCAVTSLIFWGVVVYGGEDYGSRIVVGALLVVILMIVNLVGLIVQSVFYYVCKSYHQQGIDKNTLYNQLGGYLGEYVPIESETQMEHLGA